MSRRSLPLTAALLAITLSPALARADDPPRAPADAKARVPPRPLGLAAIEAPDLGPAEALTPPPKAPAGARALADLGIPASALSARAPRPAASFDLPDLDARLIEPNRGKASAMVAGVALTSVGVAGGGLITAGLIASADSSGGSPARSVGIGFALVFGSLLIPGVPLIVWSATTPTRAPLQLSRITLTPGPMSAVLSAAF